MREIAKQLSEALGDDRNYENFSDAGVARLVRLLTEKMQDRIKRDQWLVNKATEALLQVSL